MNARELERTECNQCGDDRYDNRSTRNVDWDTSISSLTPEIFEKGLGAGIQKNRVVSMERTARIKLERIEPLLKLNGIITSEPL